MSTPLARVAPLDRPRMSTTLGGSSKIRHFLTGATCCNAPTPTPSMTKAIDVTVWFLTAEEL